MKFVIRITLISLVIILAAFTAYAQETGALQYAELGDYHLQIGRSFRIVDWPIEPLDL